MRILILTDAFYPDSVGGGSKSLYAEAVKLVNLGHETSVVIRRMKRGLPLQETIAGVKLFRYSAPTMGSKIYHTYPIFNIVGTYKHTKRLMAARRFDVVSAHYPFPALGAKFARVKIPIIYTFHAPIKSEVTVEAKRGKYNLTPLAKAAAIGLHYAEHKALQMADLIITRSEFTKELVESMHGIKSCKIQVIPLGVNTERFRPPIHIKATRQELRLPADRLILLTVRRLEGRMGVEMLIEAMRILVKEDPRILCLIIGDGYLRESLVNLVHTLGLEDHIRLLGFISEEKLPEYYGAADLFVLPTKELEGFGLSTIEALSCGTPVVGTPVGATPEILRNIGSEFVSPDVSAGSLALTILKQTSKGISAGLRATCREICLKNYSIDKVTAQLQHIFGTVARNNKSLGRDP